MNLIVITLELSLMQKIMPLMKKKIEFNVERMKIISIFAVLKSKSLNLHIELDKLIRIKGNTPPMPLIDAHLGGLFIL